MEFALSGKLFLQEPKYLFPISCCEARHTLGNLTLTQRTIKLCYLRIILFSWPNSLGLAIPDDSRGAHGLLFPASLFQETGREG